MWKLRNFTATIFLQNFRQINVFLKNFTVNQFDEKKNWWQWISRFSALCHVSFLFLHKKTIAKSPYLVINYILRILFSRIIFQPKSIENEVLDYTLWDSGLKCRWSFTKLDYVDHVITKYVSSICKEFIHLQQITVHSKCEGFELKYYLEKFRILTILKGVLK